MKLLMRVALIGLLACGASLAFATPSEAHHSSSTRRKVKRKTCVRSRMLATADIARGDEKT